jgi:hypothetical protein
VSERCKLEIGCFCTFYFLYYKPKNRGGGGRGALDVKWHFPVFLKRESKNETKDINKMKMGIWVYIEGGGKMFAFSIKLTLVS